MRLPIPPRRRYVSVIYNLYYSYYSNRNINIHIDYKLYTCKPYVMDGEGFEPSKASPADLQSVPFGHSGIHPFSETNNQCSFRCLLYHVLCAHASTFFNASSSATSVKFGCNCRIDAGTSGVTGPKKAF